MSAETTTAEAIATPPAQEAPVFPDYGQYELTEEQVKLYDTMFRPKWHKINTCVTPSDFDGAVKVLEEIYQLAETPLPPVVICSSPAAVGLNRGFFRMGLSYLADQANKFVDTAEGDKLKGIIADIQADQAATYGIELSKKTYEPWVLPVNTTGIGARFAELNSDRAHREYGAVPDFWNRVLCDFAQTKLPETAEILPFHPRLLSLSNSKEHPLYKIATDSITSAAATVANVLGKETVTIVESLLGKDWQENMKKHFQAALESGDASKLVDVTTSLANTATEMYYGQHDWWMSQFDYFFHVCPGLATHPELLGAKKLLEFVEKGSWYQAYKRVVWLCDRPYAFRMDGDNRLHSAEGPALGYRDGFKIYIWRGVQVPAKVIENPEALTIEEIDAQQNVEVRRIMIEQKTWPVYFKESDARVIESRLNPVENTVESLMEFKHGRAIMFACPSTTRVYAQEVPVETQTCDEAQTYLASGLNNRIISAA